MGMTENRAVRIIRDAGALRVNGHFVYTSDLHGDTYVDKSRLTLHPDIVHTLAWPMADPFMKDDAVDVVVAPVIGAIPFGMYAAEHLTNERAPRKTKFVYAEKAPDGTFIFRRGYDKDVAGQRVLIVEDIITTGGTSKKIVDLVRKTGGTVVGVSALWNRGGIMSSTLGVPRLISLVNHVFPQWTPEECPLCAQGIMVNTDVAHGAKFVASGEAT